MTTSELVAVVVSAVFMILVLAWEELRWRAQKNKTKLGASHNECHVHARQVTVHSADGKKKEKEALLVCEKCGNEAFAIFTIGQQVRLQCSTCLIRATDNCPECSGVNKGKGPLSLGPPVDFYGR